MLKVNYLMIRNLLLSLITSFTFLGCALEQLPDKFDQSKVSKLTEAELAQMDVEFFNIFAVRSHTSTNQNTHDIQGKTRATKVHALAEKGLEVAWIAEQFYNFKNHIDRYKKVKHGDYYWKRLKAMAEEGNASAQCLFGLSVVDHYLFNPFFKPSQSDFDKRYEYIRKAAAQNQPQCLSESAKYVPEKDKEKMWFENNLSAAKKGCARCQYRLHFIYYFGRGAEKDYSRALCWAQAATLNSDSARYAYGYRVIRSRFRNERSLGKIAKRYKLGTNCQQLID